jgi:hypothetical protein
MGFSIAGRGARESGRWRWSGNEILQNEIGQFADFGSAELGLPGHHGRSGYAIGDCSNESFAGNCAAKGGIGEVTRRWHEALLSVGGAVSSIPVADGAVEAKAFSYGVFRG